MDITLILLLLIVVVVAVIAGNVISTIIQKNNSFSPKEIVNKIDAVKKEFQTVIKPLSDDLIRNKTFIDEKFLNIAASNDKLLKTLTGSSRFGSTGELLLGNFFQHSGLVKGTQYIQNQNYAKDGTTLTVEFAIKHPTGLVLPIDSHWTKTLYEHLLELRRQPSSNEKDSQINEKYKEIIKDYENKAKKVNTKYISSPISTDFACVYVPSESLYLELNTHITENKELWVSEIQRKHKVTFMGPSTFAVYCSAILLGFNAISADKRSQNFLKHLDKFKKLLLDNYKLAEAQENKANLVYKSSTEVLRSAEKLKIEMEKVDEELHNIEKKNEN